MENDERERERERERENAPLRRSKGKIFPNSKFIKRKRLALINFEALRSTWLGSRSPSDDERMS